MVKVGFTESHSSLLQGLSMVLSYKRSQCCDFGCFLGEDAIKSSNMEFVALKNRNIVNSQESKSLLHNFNCMPSGIKSDTVSTKIRRKCGEVFIDEHDLFNFLCTLCEASFEETEKFFVHVKGVHNNPNKCITIKQEDPLGPSDDDESRALKHEPNVQITTIDGVEVKLPEYGEETVDSLGANPNDGIVRPRYNTRRRALSERLKHLQDTADEEESVPYDMNESNQAEEHELDKYEDESESESDSDYFNEKPKLDTNNAIDTIHQESKQKKGKIRPICEICGKSFASSRNLKKHKKRVNCSLIKLSKPFVCENCNTNFATRKSLRRHQRNGICGYSDKKVIPEEAPYNVPSENDNEPAKNINETETDDNVLNENKIDPKKCRYCERVFSETRRRVEHERIHTGEKPYQCRFCGKLFRVHSHVCVHEKTHTVDEEFKCDICKLTFKNKLCLKAHNKRHGEKKFPCGYCEMSFFNTRELKDHVRTHTGEKRYKCNLCEKSFISSGSFNYHKKKHSAWIQIVKE